MPPRSRSTNMEKVKNTHCRWCSAKCCKNSKNRRPDLTFFSFPKDPIRCRQWSKLANRPDLLDKLPKHLAKVCTLCSEHFEECYIRRPNKSTSSKGARKLLTKNAIPTIFGPPMSKRCSTEFTIKRKEIEVDQEPEDVKPTLDVECNLVSDAVSTDSTEEAVSKESTSFAAGSDDQYSNDGHPSPSPADLNPVLARSLQQASATTAPTRSPSLLTHTKRSMSQGSLDGETDGPASKGFKTFVVNMDSEWCSRSHSPPAPSPSPQQDVETITTVKLEPGLDFADGLMEEEIQQHNQNGHNGMAASSDMEEESHFEITAKYVMSKLSLLSNKQRIYAEKLIADVLFEAEFGNLRSQSKLNVLGS